MPKTQAKNLSKRVKTLERKVALNKPEMKCHGFHMSAVTLTNNNLYAVKLDTIAQGTAVGERIGNQVRIHKIELNFQGNQPLIDFFMIRSNDGVTLVKDDFIDAVNTMPKTYTHGNYQLLRHYCSVYGYDYATGDSDCPTGGKWVYKPKYPYTINYETTSGGPGTTPAVYFYCLNKTGLSVNFTYVVKVYYTDN
ncbi:MAG: coat protein [Cressdnaviricota sp.]|nr:MAG: coat protein [Cressdnaviricota sp.]